MINKLLDIPLSEEAKAVVSKSYYSNESIEVSTFIDLNLENDFNPEIFSKIVYLGWGDGLDQCIKFISKNQISDYEALSLAQLEVKKSNALFAVSKIKDRCYISINHALADEHTLNIIKPLVKSAYENGISCVSNKLSEGRRLYHDYLKRQKDMKKEKRLIKKQINENIIPVKLSKIGRLSWDRSYERICLDNIITLNKNITKDMIINKILTFLSASEEIYEGNIICSSKDWRLSNEVNAIGMMTGLVDLSVSNASSEELVTSLETYSKYDSQADKILKCCIMSELFINGADSRGIQASRVKNTSFPVGINVEKLNDSDFKIEIEGQFKSREAVDKLLIELSEFLINKL